MSRMRRVSHTLCMKYRRRGAKRESIARADIRHGGELGRRAESARPALIANALGIAIDSAVSLCARVVRQGRSLTVLVDLDE